MHFTDAFGQVSFSLSSPGSELLEYSGPWAMASDFQTGHHIITNLQCEFLYLLP